MGQIENAVFYPFKYNYSETSLVRSTQGWYCLLLFIRTIRSSNYKKIMKSIKRKGDTARDEQCLLFPLCFFYRIDKLPYILLSSKIVVSNFFNFIQDSNICGLRMVKCPYNWDRGEPTNHHLATNHGDVRRNELPLQCHLNCLYYISCVYF